VETGVLVGLAVLVALTVVALLYALAFVRSCMGEMRRIYERQTDAAFLKSVSRTAGEYSSNRIALDKMASLERGNGNVVPVSRLQDEELDEAAAAVMKLHQEQGLPLHSAIDIVQEKMRKIDVGPAPPIGAQDIEVG